MSDCSLLGWLNFFVLTATGGVIAWYTIETYRLRREAQLQTELQTRPFLSLFIEGEEFQRRARVVNLGHGVARGIQVQSVIVDRLIELRGVNDLTHLAPGASAILPLRLWMRLTPDDPISEVPMAEHGWNVANALDSNDVTVVMRYRSITGQQYETMIRMADGEPRTPHIIADQRMTGDD
jgi:hypothetical protein